ncbi:DUF4222 domain-containing protein [Arsenophonus sp.]|uniref:DUF4222 domain-containing protein n=1 Tax=Arsenophonus sp. TaxID=1872640 RepID=UPI0038790795
MINKPQIHKYYTNKRGEAVKVIHIESRRVIFISSNYKSLVNMSIRQFNKEYIYARNS